MINQEAEVDRSLVKIIALGAVSVALAFLFGYALSGFLIAGNFWLLITAVVAAIFFLALFIFQSFFIKSVSVAAKHFASLIANFKISALGLSLSLS